MNQLFCDGCAALLPKSLFGKQTDEDGTAKDAASGVYCLKCSGATKSKHTGYCTDCKRDWILSAFDDAELQKLSGDLETSRTARCRKCKAIQAEEVKLSRTHKCSKCAKMKAWREYSPIVLKLLLASQQRGVDKNRKLCCEDCQYPICAKCADPSKRPSMPPPASAYRKGKWYCSTCNFPPCDVCKQKPRPSKHHRYSVFTMPKWICQECKPSWKKDFEAVKTMSWKQQSAEKFFIYVAIDLQAFLMRKML